MNKKKLRPERMIVCSILFTIPIITNAQINYPQFDPKTWDLFINSTSNSIVQDTLCLQTFNNAPCDNWEYSSYGEVSIFNPKTVNIQDGSAGLALQLKGGSEVTFASMDSGQYTKYSGVSLWIPYAISDVVQGENLSFVVERRGSNFDANWIKPTGTTPYSKSFTQQKPGAFYINPTIAISNHPFSLQIKIGQASEGTKTGFYAIDSAYIFGHIQQYSLFTGEGNWQEQSNWSHHSPLRNRKALITGNVSISHHTSCNELLLGEGNVRIEPEGTLQLNNLSLNATNSSFLSFGKTDINETVTIWKKFPEKGKWYFISFPFDVYLDGIDSTFQWQDEHFSGSGNYFYVQRYNGDKRAQNNKNTGNWEVLSPSEVSEKQRIVFEKGKGYLIALDTGATTQEITFTSQKGDINTDFGKQGTIPIKQPSFTHTTEERHKGWILCGNPLPSPLPVSCIDKEVLYDEWIYISNGDGYDTYDINSNYTIPPYSAFFIRAKKNIDLPVEVNESAGNSQLLSSLQPIETAGREPEYSATPTSNNTIYTTDVQIGKNGIWIHHLFSTGYATIVDLNGNIIYHQVISPLQAYIPLSLNKGMYICTIQTGKCKSHHKFIWGD